MSIFISRKHVLIIILFILLFISGCASTLPNTNGNSKGTAEKADLRGDSSVLLRNYDNLIALLQNDQLQEALLLLDDNAILSEETEILMAQLYLSIGEIDEAKMLIHGIQSKNSTTKLLFLQAQIAILEGHINEAIPILEEIVGLEPDNTRALNALGMTSLEIYAYDRAEKYFNQSMKVAKTIDAIIGMANVYTAQEKEEEAIEILNDAIQENPDNYLLYAERGMVHTRAHSFDNAISDFTTSIEQESDYAWNYFDRARVYMEVKQLQKAKVDVTKFLELRPDVFLAYVVLAQTNDLLGEPANAIANYEKAIEIRDDYYPAFIPLAVLYYENDNLSGASNFFRRYYNETGKEHPEYALLAAICLMENDKRDVANAYLDTVLSEIKHGNIFLDIVKLFRNGGRENQVKRLVSSVSDDKNAHYRLQFYLAAYYELQGYQSSANVLYEQVDNDGVKGFAETRLAHWKMRKTKQDKGHS